MALYVDPSSCKPSSAGNKVGHVVRVSDQPRMTVVDEFTDGGSFEHEDCGPASLQSWFVDKTDVQTTIKEIEDLAGTNLNGTGFKGLEVAGQHFGLEIKFSPDNPAPGYIMNPGGFASVVDISQFPAYLATTQGGCLVLPNIVPLPPTPEEEMPKLGQFIAKTTTGQLAYFISDGMHFRHVLNPQDEAGVTVTAPWFNGDGQALRLWNPNPVADVAAFGVPANAETAALLGLTFP